MSVVNRFSGMVGLSLVACGLLGTLEVRADDLPPAVGMPVVDSAAGTHNNSTSLGRSMIVDRVDPSAIPFPVRKENALPALAPDAKPGLVLGHESPQAGETPAKKSRRTDRFGYTPVKVAAPLSAFALFGVGVLMARRSSRKSALARH